MQIKFDVTTESLLTKETKNPVTGVIESVCCDLDGNPLGFGDAPIPTLLDLNGKRFGRVAAQLPSLSDPVSVALKDEILKRNPVFFASDDGKFRGYYVPVADFTYHATPTQ